MNAVVRKTLVDALRQTGIIRDHYILKGSTGQGQWAAVPWLAIMDSRITKSTQSGVYIVYLFAENGQALYLTMNQGCSKQVQALGRSSAINELLKLVSRVRGIVPCPIDFISGNDINLGNILYEKACIFYKCYSLNKFPSDEVMINDLRRLLSTYADYYEAIKDEITDVTPDTSGSSLTPSPINSPQEEQPSIVPASDQNLSDVLHNIRYKLLLNTLQQDGIYTVQQYIQNFSQTSLIRYVNQRNLYLWKERLIIVAEVNLIFRELKSSNKINPESSVQLENIRHTITPTDSKPNVEWVINLGSKQADLTFTTPTQAVFGGDVQPTKSWADFYIQVCEYLFREYPEKMRLQVDHPIRQGSRRMLFFREKPRIGLMSKKLSNGLWACTNFSAINLFRTAQDLCLKCGHPLTHIEIYYIRNYEIPEQNTEGKIIREKRTNYRLDKRPSVFDSRRLEDLILSYKLSPQPIGRILKDANDPAWTFASVSKAIDANLQIVEISKGAFIHRKSIVDVDEAAATLLRILQLQFKKFDEYCNKALLFDAACVDLSLFMNDNAFESAESIYALTKHLFSKEGFNGQNYVFYGNEHIWEHKPDYPLSLKGLIINKAQLAGGKISRDECEAFLDRIKMGQGNLNVSIFAPDDPTFYLYDRGEYLLSESLHIDAEWQAQVRHALDALLTETRFVILRDIREDWYSKVPKLPLNLEWTPLLLQEVLHFNESIGYKALCPPIQQSRDTVAAAIAPMDSSFNSFADVVNAYLGQVEELPQRFSVDDLRLKLLEAGMITGNELIYAMHKALNDHRFAWTKDNKTVLVRRD